MDIELARHLMIEQQIRPWDVLDKTVLDLLFKVRREDFVPEAYRALAGAITFIPYIGAIIGGALAIGLALFQFWGDWFSIGTIVAIFAFGQFIEGNILTPRLVGKSVGLHPVWLLFALSAFGSMFGFVGMLVAVPVAATIGVFTRYGISQYQESVLFRGAISRLHVPEGPAQDEARD